MNKDLHNIQIKFIEDVVYKQYPPTQKEKFAREAAAFEHLMKLGVEFVPSLLEYDVKELTLVIKKAPGKPLTQTIVSASNIMMNAIIDGLIRIDRFLYQHRINYLHSSPTDIIFDTVQQQLYIVDFEYTFVESAFKQILYDRMFHPRMMRVENQQARDEFLNCLKARKLEFEKYLFRKFRNFAISRYRMLKKPSFSKKLLLR